MTAEDERAGWVMLPDQSVAIRYWMDGDYVMEFRVFDACQSQAAGDTEWTWVLFDGTESYELAEWEKASWTIGGGLKWDGCINWETNPDCMMHGCSPSHCHQISAIFQTVYHVGKRYLDLLGDEVPPMPATAIEAGAHREGEGK